MKRIFNILDLPEPSQRMMTVINHFSRGNVADFVSKLPNIGHQSLNRIFNIDSRTGAYPSISGNILTAIMAGYPNVNTTWIMTGEGEMLKKLPKGQGDAGSEPSARELLIILAKAFDKQEENTTRHLAAYDKFADVLKIQADLMTTINKNMAREETQAKVIETVNRIDANLTETLAGVEFVSGRQLQKILGALAELRSDNKAPAPDSRKKSGENGGDGHKSGIKS